jgi:hypothetical protein
MNPNNDNPSPSKGFSLTLTDEEMKSLDNCKQLISEKDFVGAFLDMFNLRYSDEVSRRSLQNTLDDIFRRIDLPQLSEKTTTELCRELDKASSSMKHYYLTLIHVGRSQLKDAFNNATKWVDIELLWQYEISDTHVKGVLLKLKCIYEFITTNYNSTSIQRIINNSSHVHEIKLEHIKVCGELIGMMDKEKASEASITQPHILLERYRLFMRIGEEEHAFKYMIEYSKRKSKEDHKLNPYDAYVKELKLCIDDYIKASKYQDVFKYVEKIKAVDLEAFASILADITNGKMLFPVDSEASVDNLREFIEYFSELKQTSHIVLLNILIRQKQFYFAILETTKIKKKKYIEQALKFQCHIISGVTRSDEFERIRYVIMRYLFSIYGGKSPQYTNEYLFKIETKGLEIFWHEKSIIPILVACETLVRIDKIKGLTQKIEVYDMLYKENKGITIHEVEDLRLELNEELQRCS